MILRKENGRFRIIDMPENIKCCKYLRCVDASVNPLGKLPEGFTQLLNLTQLFLNDTFLDYLPGNFGRLSKLKILELRENHLKTLPKSFSRLTELERLDVGHNEFTELPDVLGNLTNLLELWCDHNQITQITPTLGNLKQLMFLDASKNKLQSLPTEIEGCTSLADLHLTTNQLQSLPDSIGNLENLTTLKVDDNRLVSLPTTVGGLSSLSELNVSANELEDLPASLGLLRNIRTLYADENYLTFVPSELGSCNGITVLSLRGNKLEYIPDEIGRIPRLRVLNLSDNRLKCLPFTFVKLKELQALWLSENQTRPLVPLQSDHDPDTGRKILTCYLLPQEPNTDNGGDHGGDTDSFHPSMWDEERERRQQIHFEFNDDVGDQMSPTGGADLNDVHVREARISKPSSPSLHETHRLYRYDKEKLAKDKARMHHRGNSAEQELTLDLSQVRLSKERAKRHSGEITPDCKPPQIPIKVPGKGKKINGSEEDDGGFSGRENSRPNSAYGSNPNVSSQNQDYSRGGKPQQSPGFAYASPNELAKSFSQYGYAPVSQSQNRKHRSHRDYDSDTGYRSESGVTRYSRQQMLAQYGGNSDITVTPCKPRRKDGYSSDVEGYSQRTQNTAYRLQQQPLRNQSKSNSLPYNLNSNPQDMNRTNQADIGHMKTQLESASRTPLGDNSVNRTPHGENVNQSLHGEILNRSSRPENVNQSPYGENFNRTPQGENVNRTPQMSHNRRVVVRNDDLYSQQLQHNSQKAVENKNLSTLSYQPPSPSQFHHSKIIDQSTPVSSEPPSGFTFNTSRSRSNSASGSNNDDNEVRNSDWRKDMYNDNLPSQNYQRRTQQNSSPTDRPPPYKPAPPYLQGAGAGAVRKLPPTPSRTSPYGVYNYDKRTSNSPIMYQRINEVPNTENCDKHNEHRTQGYHGNQHQSNYRQNDISYGDNVYSASYITSENLRTPEMSKRSMTPLSQTNPERSRTPGSVVGDERRNSRDSPRESGYGSREQSSHRNSPNDSNHSHKHYYDPYNSGSSFEPGDSRNPVMSTYDDVEMYKSDDPLSQVSQVSSSTDSGYHQFHTDQTDSPSKYSGKTGFGMPPPSRAPPDPSSYTYSTPNAKDFPSREATPDHSSTSSSSVPVYTQNSKKYDKFHVAITKNPGLGFSIAGGIGSQGNPYRPDDNGIFITKVSSDGPATLSLRPGDKVLEVNGQDFNNVNHEDAVNVMKNSKTVSLYVEREFL
ncbi:Protein lap1,Leucine-rich repeat-containing protein 7,Protein lap4,Protein scribble homolog,Leucine-rich repeat-containing protein 1,Erbin [Mytilus coruscus]|uniref:Protein lap1,Leucine-rich repeat-containing protein 7,Protein lap4,Protein scribble homolog,Leucine-rich repeat-containing protein 1,Erbin n=1 Tax=Mytilus coruscus TaxID=42192 RepID=A0A6J8AHK8_MYTCO|nr:Protein lap1,Leucine-rich repeat-containing protein 7,Protein lap4,Protein scribble homolog,Leucine-rich repeat-containing protein 1,Erbin [Mytilus coruscus]